MFYIFWNVKHIQNGNNTLRDFLVILKYLPENTFGMLNLFNIVGNFFLSCFVLKPNFKLYLRGSQGRRRKFMRQAVFSEIHDNYF